MTCVLDLQKGIGRVVREARVHRGMTQRELGERSNLTTNFISHLETGTRQISIRSLNKVADVLGVPAYVFVCLYTPPEPGHFQDIVEFIRGYSRVELYNALRDK